MWPDGGAMYLATRENLHCLMPGNWQRKNFMSCQAHHYDKQLPKGNHQNLSNVRYTPVRIRHDPNHNARATELLDNLQSVEDFLTSGAIPPGRTAENRWNKLEEGENTRST